MHLAQEDVLMRLQQILQNELSGVPLKFAVQVFQNHLELWVYVLETGEYDRVRSLCSRLTAEMELDCREPEIWLLPTLWSGPWYDEDTEHKLRERRDNFKRQHGIAVK